MLKIYKKILYCCIKIQKLQAVNGSVDTLNSWPGQWMQCELEIYIEALEGEMVQTQ